jgi:hypothetical protein
MLLLEMTVVLVCNWTKRCVVFKLLGFRYLILVCNNLCELWCMWAICKLFVKCVVTCDLLYWIMYDRGLYVAWFEILLDFIGLRFYMGSSVIVWLLQWLLLYLCSYKLDGSVIVGIEERFNIRLIICVFKTNVFVLQNQFLTTYSYVYRFV